MRSIENRSFKDEEKTKARRVTRKEHADEHGVEEQGATLQLIVKGISGRDLEELNPDGKLRRQ